MRDWEIKNLTEKEMRLIISSGCGDKNIKENVAKWEGKKCKVK